MPRIRPASLAVALCLLALPAFAEEGPTPAENYAATATALPAPSDQHAFAFEGEAVMGGMPVKMAFQAKPGKGPKDEPVWIVEESIEVGGGVYARTSTATLDRHLAPLSGKVTGKQQGGGPFEIWWERTEGGFKTKHSVTKNGESTVEEKVVPYEGGRITTAMTSLWLFTRMVLPKKSSYASMVFEPDPGPGSKQLEEATWRTGEEDIFDGKKVLTVKGEKGSAGLVGFFDPETRAFLGTTLTDGQQGYSVTLRPVKGDKPEAEDDLYARPAKTAKEAALQAGLGFSTGDVDLVMRITDWAGIHAAAKAAYEEKNAENPDAKPFPDLEAFKATYKANLAQQLPKMPKSMMQNLLKSMEENLVFEEQADGTTRVTFPPMFRNFKVDVREVDGVWLVARMPVQPK